MHKWILTAVLWNTPVYADCIQAAEAVRACFAGWEQQHEAKLLEDAPGESSAGIEAAQALTAALYESEITIHKCIGMGERFADRCEKENPRLVEDVSRELAPVAARMPVSLEKAKSRISENVNQVNAHLPEKRYAFVCDMKSLEDGGYQICFVVDKASSESEFIPVQRAGLLPVQVGVTEACTFFADGDNRIVSADHCGLDHLKQGWIFAPDSPAVSARAMERLDFVRSSFERGPALEDVTVFHTDQAASGLRGKALYYFALDRSLERGCVLRESTIVACSESTARELNGLRAEILAFPGSYYAGSEGEFRRVAPQSVLRVRGDLTFDAHFGRFYVNAYVQGGSSGAPVYVPAGFNLAGLWLDRPLVLGPLTGLTGTRGKMEASGWTDNMAIVGAVQYDRLAKVLNTIRVETAFTSTVR